jgi:hypothetical protein
MVSNMHIGKYLEYKSYFPGNNPYVKEPWLPLGNEWDDPMHPSKIVRVDCLND